MTNHTPRKPPDWVLHRINSQLKYNPKTGGLTWIKVSKGSKRKVGDKAGTISSSGDYKFGSVVFSKNNKSIGIKTNHIAWYKMIGEWPKTIIDHEDGNSLNDAWYNLRAASSSQNSTNRIIRNDNTSGLTGINFNRGTNNYMVRICKHGKRIYLGCFASLDEAKQVRINVEKLFHKEYVRNYK